MQNSPNGDWLIAYTYPNAEKKINNLLLKWKIDAYLPLQKVVREWSRGKKKLEVPLFPNYIFIRTEEKERWDILSLPGIVKFLSYNGKLSRIADKEINTIKKILVGDFEISMSNEYNFALGDKVKVTRGPLIGLEGILYESKGEKRFIVRFEAIDKMISLNISANCLTKLENTYEHALK